MSKFFISDLHLGHRMMASMRGFESVWEHDEHIIEAWNEVVTNPDWEVYLLGDISFHKSSVAAHLFNRLNGRIHLIEGNHDKKNLKSAYLKERFESIQDYLEIRPGFTEGRIILFHYPIMSWRGMWHGTWHLHGHCHGKLKNNHMRRVDMSWECWKKPATWSEVVARAYKEFPQGDHIQPLPDQ